MNEDVCEADYAIWCERSTIADCFRDLNLPRLAEKVMDLPANIGIIEQYLSIIKREANRVKNIDVLSRLYFSGLIYG